MTTKTSEMETELAELVALRAAHHARITDINNTLGRLMASRAAHEDAIFGLRDQIYTLEQLIIDTTPPPSEH